MTITKSGPGNISGVYLLHLDIATSEKVADKNPKLKPIEHAASRPLSLYVHEREDGEVVAHLGAIDFEGSRRDGELTLTTSGMPLKALEQLPEGVSEQTGAMKLTLAGDKWSGNFKLLDQITINVALERQGELPSVSIDDLAGVSRDSVGDILCDAIKTIINTILDALEIEIGNSLRPMSACGLSHDGRGYYLFGRDAPGSNWPPVFLSTIYMPYDTVVCGKTSHPYNFSVSLGDFAFSPQTILDTLRDVNNDFLKLIGIDITSFLDDLQGFLNTIDKGRFAVSFQYSVYTGSGGLYFNNALGITTDDLYNSGDFAWFRTLLNGINSLVPGKVFVYAGETCSDTWNAYNGIIPMCNVPFLFAYLFGTANVNYD